MDLKQHCKLSEYTKKQNISNKAECKIARHRKQLRRARYVTSARLSLWDLCAAQHHLAQTLNAVRLLCNLLILHKLNPAAAFKAGVS